MFGSCCSFFFPGGESVRSGQYVLVLHNNSQQWWCPSYFLIWNCCTVNVIDMVSRGASVGTRGGHPAMKPLQRTEELKREMIFYCTPEYEFNSFPSLLQYVLDTSSGNYDLLS